MINRNLLKELLHYDPITGLFTWKSRDIKHFNNYRDWKWWNGRFAEKTAGSRRKKECGKTYIFIYIFNRPYAAHRLAWLYMTGALPDKVDHGNGDGTANWFLNLRNVDSFENAKNIRKQSRNTSGHLGVSWNKGKLKWAVQIKSNGKYKHLGYFSNIDDAISTRRLANIKYGFHPNHGTERPL